MHRLHTRAHWLTAAGFGLFLTVHDAAPGEAACNLIPGTIKSFNSTLGATNRPFAAPGEIVEVRVRPCDAVSTGLTASAANHLVTVGFPTGTAHTVVLTADADCTATEAKIASECPGLTATCVAAPFSGLQIYERDGVRLLRLRFPDTDDVMHVCSGGAFDGQPCRSDSTCAGASCTGGDNDDITLSGPKSREPRTDLRGEIRSCESGPPFEAARSAGGRRSNWERIHFNSKTH